jgi:hypothetical protein
MPQSTVQNIFTVAFVGMEPDNSRDDDNYISRVSSEASNQIPFGVVVKDGATLGVNCLNVAGQTGNYLGIVPYAAVYQVGNYLGTTVDANGNKGLLPGTDISIKRRGRLWVQIDEDVSAGQAVKFRTANASAGVGPGTFRKTAAAGNTVDCSKFAKWVGVNLAANGFGLLEFDFTMSGGTTND